MKGLSNICIGLHYYSCLWIYASLYIFSSARNIRIVWCPKSSHASQTDIEAGSKFVPKAYCRFGDQVVTALITSKQAATDPFVRNSLVCTTPSVEDPSYSAMGYKVSQMSFSINGKLNEFSNSIPFRYAVQKVVRIIPETGRANARAMTQTLTVRGTNFVNAPELTCFFTPTDISVHDSSILETGTSPGSVPPRSLRLATKAHFLDSENVICPAPSAWEYPLKCTCQCPGAVCGA